MAGVTGRTDAAERRHSPHPAAGLHPSLHDEYAAVRKETESICALLETEDHVVQPAAFISPPKWHLAHTTWFFDRFVLQQGDRHLTELLPDCNLLFNSYYKSQGRHWLQGNRGHLARPTVSDVLVYRRDVDERIAVFCEAGLLTGRLADLMAIGIQHEKQHQELLLMDIKYIFASHPHPVAYDSHSRPPRVLPVPTAMHWLEFPETLCICGAGSEGFTWDNERPRHRRLLPGFRLASRLVTNAEWLAFMNDAGYRRAELWLSDGWDWRNEQDVEAPLYWQRRDAANDALTTIAGDWLEYHPGGIGPLHPHLPVSHVSYYEADAYARWSGARLPTEFELEYWLAQETPAAEPAPAYWQTGSAICPLPARAADIHGNGLLWQWTQSPYLAYPGYVPEAGALAEYNAKFMCNQFVLKGGSVATPRRHLRPSYRNFYRPWDRWQFCGLRLAKDQP